MSMLSLIPTPFPLEVRLDDVPYSYKLKSDRRESDAALLLLSIWAITAVFLIHIVTHPLALIDGSYNRFIAALGMAAVVGVVMFFGNKIRGQLALSRTGVLVNIDHSWVQVSGAGAIKDWLCPLTNFTGLMEVNLGNRKIGGRTQPMVGLILQHEDETCSIPLIITRPSQWDASKIYAFAEALDVPVLTEKRLVCGR